MRGAPVIHTCSFAMCFARPQNAPRPSNTLRQILGWQAQVSADRGIPRNYFLRCSTDYTWAALWESDTCHGKNLLGAIVTYTYIAARMMHVFR